MEVRGEFVFRLKKRFREVQNGGDGAKYRRVEELEGDPCLSPKAVCTVLVYLVPADLLLHLPDFVEHKRGTDPLECDAQRVQKEAGGHEER